VELFEVIRREHREEGVSIRTLARHHNVHRRTVRQALASALPPPRVVPVRTAPLVAPLRPIIRAWLDEDRSAPRKQRHTARRIWQRLTEEHAAPVAESTVRQHVRELRSALEGAIGTVTIVACHPPGEEAEVDASLSHECEIAEGHRTPVDVPTHSLPGDALEAPGLSQCDATLFTPLNDGRSEWMLTAALERRREAKQRLLVESRSGNDRHQLGFALGERTGLIRTYDCGAAQSFGRG